MITIQKIDETFAQVSFDDDGVKYELNDHLTFEVPSAKFSPAYKQGYWDGKIRLLRKDQTVYTGLKDELEKFCIDRHYKFTAIGYNDDKVIDKDKLKNLINSWKPTRFNDALERVNLDMYPEQLDAIHSALSKKRLIVESATAAGKSFIIVSLIKLFAKKDVLVIVPRIGLANQLLNDFNEYYEKWNPDIDVLYTGQKVTGAKILISTWQSVSKKDKSFFDRFDAVIYDEVHEADSKSACKILEACNNAEYKIGLTGTLKDCKTHILTLQGLFGKSIKFSKAVDNIEAGVSSNLKIKVKHLTYSKPLEGKFKNGGEMYNAELKYIWLNKERNHLIYEDVRAQNGTSIVLFKNVAHGELLFKEYKSLHGDKDVFIIHGSSKNPEDVKQYIRENPTKRIVLFASLGTFSTGVNIKSISYAILAAPIKDKIKLLQSIGRGLRKSDVSDLFVFVDIVDDIPKGKILKKHAKVRIMRYIEEDFNYSVEKYDLT